jgi:site-specific DNA-cytosine methylase
VAENVGGLRNANDGLTFNLIMAAFILAGYRIYPHLYNFEQYGIPQARHRIIIVGIRKDLPWEFTMPRAPNTINTCREALENPPIPPVATNHERTHQSPLVEEWLQYITPGENAFTAALPAHLRLNVRGAEISQIYRRLDPHRPAFAITGSGSATHVYHWDDLYGFQIYLSQMVTNSLCSVYCRFKSPLNNGMPFSARKFLELFYEKEFLLIRVIPRFLKESSALHFRIVLTNFWER